MRKTKALYVRYEFWNISQLSLAKQQREMTKFKVLWRTWAHHGKFFTLCLNLNAVHTSSVLQIDSKLPCVCSVIDHRWRQNVVRTKKWQTSRRRVCHWCSYHILTSSMIYYWTDARQHGIYLFYTMNTKETRQTCLVALDCSICASWDNCKVTNATFHVGFPCRLLLVNSFP